MIYILCTITACILSVYLGWCLKTCNINRYYNLVAKKQPLSKPEPEKCPFYYEDWSM